MSTKVKHALRKALVMILIFGTVFGMIPGLDQVGLAIGEATGGAIGLQEADAYTIYYIPFSYYDGSTNSNGAYTQHIYMTQEVRGGRKLTKPADPTRAGYTFDKWYKIVENNNQGPYDFNATVNGRFSLFGRWLQTVEVTAYDITNGTTGGGTVKATGAIPNSSSNAYGPLATFTKPFFEDETYVFQATAADDYVFMGWAFNSPTNTPIKFIDNNFNLLYLNQHYGEGGRVRSIHAVFKEKTTTSSEDYNIYATEGDTGSHYYSLNVTGDDSGPVDPIPFFTLEDPSDVADEVWEGLVNGKIPAGGSVVYKVAIKDNVPLGEYSLRVIYNGYETTIYNIRLHVSHALNVTHAQAANCENDGHIAYWTCSVCNKIFGDSSGTIELQLSDTILPALGHRYGEWQSYSDTQHRHYCANNHGHFETRDHYWDDGVITPATCTENGVKTFTCVDCNKTKTETINKLNHNYGAWTKLDNNQHQKVCQNDSTHIVKENHIWGNAQITTPATETETGIKTSTCTKCPATKTEVIPVLSHTHNLTVTPAKNPTCTEAGNYAYWTCSGCGKVFSNSAGTNETTVTAMTRLATGHDYGTWVKVDNNQHKRVCDNDNTHVETASHSWDDGVVTTQPTETSTGIRTHTCGDCNAKKTQTIPQLTHEHNYGPWTKVDNSKHQRVCGKDSSHIEQAPHNWNNGVVTKLPTCTETGTKTYVCSTCSGSKTESISATGHDWGAWTKLNNAKHQRVCNNDSSHVETAEHSWDNGVVTTEPTTTSTGVRTFTCSVCNAKKTESISAIEEEHTHTMVRTSAKSATCDKPGNYAYWTCSGCGKVFSNSAGTNETTVAAMRIPATGHDYTNQPYIAIDATNHKRLCLNDNSHETVAPHNWFTQRQLPTCWEEGKNTYTCLSCGFVKEETVPKVAHTLTKTAAKAATCTAKGNIEYYKCSECYKYFRDSQGKNEINQSDTVIASLGHSYGSWTTTAAPTCDATGTKERTCSRCNNKQTETIAATGHAYSGQEFIPVDETNHKQICANDPTHVKTAKHNFGTHTLLASCWAEGKKTYTCQSCGYVKEETLPKTAHTLTKTAAKAATCTAAGNKAYWTCSVCYGVFSNSAGTNETTVAAMRIPATGHDWGPWTKLNNTQHQRVCENDSTHVENKNHTWDEGVVTKEPTTTATGTKTYTCTVCNAKKTETLPKLSEDNPGGTGGDDSPGTPSTHTHNLTKVSAKEPTCEEPGTRQYWKCSGCNKVFSNSAGTNETTVVAMRIPATGHDYAGAMIFVDGTYHKQLCANDTSHVKNIKHNFSTHTLLATCWSEGKKTYTCGGCGYVKEETLPKTAHTLSKTAAKAATCVASGNKAYWTCSVCYGVFSDSAGKNETTVAAMRIPATGHKYGAWTKLNNTQHQRVCEHDSAHVEKANHTWNNGVVTTKPTTTSTGVKTYTCTTCNAKRTETLPKISGDNPGGDSGDDSGEDTPETPATHSHTLVKTAAKAATCTASGNKAYWTCSGCKKVFSNSIGTAETTIAAMTIAAKGHNYGEWTKVSATQHQRVCKNDSAHVIKQDHTFNKHMELPTCWSEGKNTYTCNGCGFVKTETVAKIPHVLKKVEKEAATCNTSGHIAYYKCTECFKLFKDSKAVNEITLQDTLINPIGHKYGDYVIVDEDYHQKVCANDPSHIQKTKHNYSTHRLLPTCWSEGKNTYTCMSCGFKKEEVVEKKAHTLVKTAAKAATCTASGNKAYYRCSVCYDYFSDANGKKQIKLSDTVVPAKGHTYGEWTKVNATQHKRVCKNDSSHVQTANHTWDAGKITKAATETTTGIRTYTCKDCKATKTETIPKVTHAHKLTKTAAKAATCTTAGNKAYWTCSGCKKVYSDSAATKETTVADMTIKATGHNYGAWTKLNATQHQRVCKNDNTHVEKASHTWDAGKVTKEPTNKATGVKTYTCTKCSAVKTEGIPKLNPETPATHTHVLVKTKAKLPTCTTDGYNAYWTCSDCKKIFADSKAAKETTMDALKLKKTGHNYTPWEVTLEAGCDTEGKESCYCINNPDHVKTRTIKATGHDWGAWTELNNMYHSRTCKKNVGHVERKEHTWKEQVTKKATATAEGNLKKTCTVCGRVVNEVIPKTGGYDTPGTMDRIAGADRYATARDIADEYMKTKNIGKLKYIIVACGTNFPDALAASSLSKAKNAPVILWRDKENAKVQQYIRENLTPSGGVVYILGGTGAVADTVKSGMNGYTFVRLGGDTRYETNLKILKKANVKSGELFVCTGTEFQNALIASATGKPMLMVTGKGLRAPQKEFLASMTNLSVTILGGTNSVSAEIEAELKSYTSNVKRITGSTPDQISAKVAKAYYTSPTEVILARDDAFPDGLCAGPLAMAKKAPLLLVSNSSYANSKAYCAGLKIKNAIVLGGDSYIHDSTVKAVANIK